MQLKFYNTLIRKKEPFAPLEGDAVRLYTCGPTVYNYQHIGNYRTYVFEDVLKRVLKRFGYRVRHVMNITDVGHLTSQADTGEDKVEMEAKKEGKSAWDVAKFYAEAFLRDIDALNIERSDILCKATDHIPEQIALIKRLEANGVTYKIADGIYFDTSRFPQYGRLDPSRLEGQKAGARVEVVEGKRHPQDFALWKFTPPDRKRQMEWDSPWGRGFPGWHIECSAMAMKYLGESFDIHCGGVDHVSIHHTNEIAQAEAATGKPFVKYWLHGEFLLMAKAKMAKSAGGFVTLAGLSEKGIDPLAYRLFCFSAHYRKPLEFSWEALAAAQKSLGTLREHTDELRGLPADENAKAEVQAALDGFDAALADDLNMPAAMAEVWACLRSPKISPAGKRALLESVDQVLGLRLLEKREAAALAPHLMALIQEREKARKNKDFARADMIRKDLFDHGVVLEDTAQGPRWKVLH
jgi:cysteinyl-tRNA synthetase